MIHVAGTVLVAPPGRMRQRCSWCGALMIDYHLERMRMAVPEGQDPTPGAWQVGALVEIDGGASCVVAYEQGDPLPAGSCVLLEAALLDAEASP